MEIISNDTFIEAKENQDNKTLINSILHKYNKVFAPEELSSIGDIALWKTLMNHKENMGQKFTTSLYRYVTWEVLIALRDFNKNTKYNTNTVSSGTYDAQHSFNSSERVELMDALNVLAPKNREAVFEYYVENRTLSEISQRHDIGIETIRKRIKQGIQTLKDKCN